MKKIIILASIIASSAAYSATTASPNETTPIAASKESNAETPMGNALKLFAEGKHEEALKLAEPLAEQGDADALYLMGFANESGKAPAASIHKAIEFYRKGIEKKHADSIYRLAFIFISSGKKNRIEEARDLLEKQALVDPAVSGRILGEMFLNGALTGEPAHETAVSWWEKSSEAGDIPSMLFLARLYDGQLGIQTKNDPKLAHQYLLMAAEKGSPGAMAALGSRLLNRKDGKPDEENGIAWLKKAIAAKDYSAHLALGEYQQLVKKDDKEALSSYTLGAGAGQSDCMIRAAAFHLSGKGTEKNTARGNELLEKAAKAGNPDAHLLLAQELSKEKEPDVGRMYGHLLSAANTGSSIAQNELGLFYFSGKLGVADVSAALSWFARSAQAGFASAQNNLASMHERGLGVEQNFDHAAKLYTLAAKQGHSEASFALARLHANGQGVALSKELAWAWASLATEQGDKEKAAKFLLELNKTLSEEQLAAAKKELIALKSETPK